MDENFLVQFFSTGSDPSHLYHEASAEIIRLKEDLQKVIKKEKVNAAPVVAKTSRLVARAARLNESAKEACQLIHVQLRQRLIDYSKELEQFYEQYERNRLILAALQSIDDVHANLVSADVCIKSKSYYECAVSLQKALDERRNCAECDTLELLNSLDRELDVIRGKLFCDLVDTWENVVCISYNQTFDRKNVEIKLDTERLGELEPVVRTVRCLNDVTLLSKFFNNLKENVLFQVAEKESKIETFNKSRFAFLKITFMEHNKPIHYSQVFENLVSIIEFFKVHFDVDYKDGENIYEMIGKSVAQDLSSHLVKNCLLLSDAMSGNSSQSKSLSEIVSSAEELQKKLRHLKFLPENFGSLFDTENSSTFVVNYMHLSYLDQARTLSTCDLHTTVKSEAIPAPNWKTLADPVIECVKESFNLGQKRNILDSLQISKSASELWALVEAITEEAGKTSSDHSIRLLYTIRNMLEIYGAVVPLHHRKLLDSFPQQAALLHNNCLYFAIRLLILSCECQAYSAEIRIHYHIFLDQAAHLRKLAVSTLEKCITNQRSQLISTLLDSGFSKLKENANLDPDTELSIRRCMRQLQLLRNVWYEILPSNVYANTMGFFVDEFTQTVVAIVTDAEDISAQAADELIRIFEIVEDRLPKLFHDPKEVFRLCRKWDRFCELKIVLGSNLEKISERWASGMGPMAYAFTKTEAQGLIRALFKNTERRAALLSHIYNTTVTDMT